MNESSHKQELQSGNRFAFGDNWRQFLDVVDDERISSAELSLKTMLRMDSLEGMSFLDIGSGSGLFSLAARRLGAQVRSFDYDPASVNCAVILKEKYAKNDDKWIIGQGSALDREFIRSLGTYDIVYSWGVLHHTGDMWRGLELAEMTVKQGGYLFIAIYNDQGAASNRWRKFKKLYCKSSAPVKTLLAVICAVWLYHRTFIKELLMGKPFDRIKNYGKGSARGMSYWRDLVDWAGGYPFEVAKPEEIFEFYRDKGYMLENLITCGGGLGCNQYVFRKNVKNG